MQIPERVDFDRVADIYDETRAVPEPFFTKALDVMERYLDKQERILDIGVGTGRFARPFQKRGFDMVGIDISEKMLGVGISKGLRNAVLADARCIPFKDKTFHSNLSVHLLHLVPDWFEVLQEALRVTRAYLLTYSQFWPEEENVSPNLLYEELTTKLGCESEPLGLHEKDLPDLVEPYAREHIGSRRETVLADERIDRLKNRIYSVQWSIPDDIHKRVIEEVKERFAGKKIRMVAHLYVFVWRIEDLNDYVSLITDESLQD